MRGCTAAPARELWMVDEQTTFVALADAPTVADNRAVPFKNHEKWKASRERRRQAKVR